MKIALVRWCCLPGQTMGLAAFLVLPEYMSAPFLKGSVFDSLMCNRTIWCVYCPVLHKLEIGEVNVCVLLVGGWTCEFTCAK